MRTLALLGILIALLATTTCVRSTEDTPNPWLVPFRKRHGSAVSRSQMRAMVRLGNVYRQAGMEEEYTHSLITAVELYAGDQDVTFELLNLLIAGINESRSAMSRRQANLTGLGIDPEALTPESLPSSELARTEALAYLKAGEELEAQYENCYRIMSVACGQIPYKAELYYRTAELQYLRANEGGDRDKYKDAINFLKRAIASDSGHLESYYLIALAYEKLGDTDRAIRFWRLFEVIYEIAPEVMGEEFVTDRRREYHREALAHLELLGASTDE